MKVIALVFILLILFISSTVPIGISMGMATLIAITFLTDKVPMVLMSQNCFAGLDSFPLMAIPFFMLAGELMGKGGVSRKLLNFAECLIGFITGGLGMVTVLGCMFFAAISGSGPATVSAMGSIMIPTMENRGYDKGYSAALTAAAGSIGVIIPPSIPFVIYGVVTGVSISDMFKAGVIPGIMIGLFLMVTNYFMAKKYGYGASKAFPTLREVWLSFKEAIWALLAPVIILGGIYGGIFTPTEAAVVGCVYALIIGKFVYKELDKVNMFDCFVDSMTVNGATSFIIGISTTFAHLLALEQAPVILGNLLTTVSDSRIVVLLLINLFLLILGCFIDNISSCIILAPILLPIVTGFGMDPVHFGVAMTVNLAIGFVTPPYGANLFVASAVSSVPMSGIIKHIVPFILAMLIALMLITFIPWFTLALI